MVADAVSSRTQTDRQLALERMDRIGAFVNTTESVALSLVGDAAHPKFKVKYWGGGSVYTLQGDLSRLVITSR